MKILNIVETAYRATLEEQDDTILWLSRALVNAGADLTILLRGNAVNYIVKQMCPPLGIGKLAIQHPAQPNEDLMQLQARGVKIYAIENDIEERGIRPEVCIAGVERVRYDDIGPMMEAYDQVWHW